MNVKRLFGTLLSILGIIGMIYAAYIFINSSGRTLDYKVLAMAAILGLIFFTAGMGLMRTIKDDTVG